MSFSHWIVLTCLMVFSTASPFTNCNDETSGIINSIQIDDCPDGSETCILKRGSKVSVKIDFNNTKHIAAVTSKAWAQVSFLPVSYALPEADGCIGSGIECPITPNNKYTYAGNIDVDSVYLPMNLKVQWALVDADGNYIICAIIPVQIE